MVTNAAGPWQRSLPTGTRVWHLAAPNLAQDTVAVEDSDLRMRLGE